MFWEIYIDFLFLSWPILAFQMTPRKKEEVRSPEGWFGWLLNQVIKLLWSHLYVRAASLSTENAVICSNFDPYKLTYETDGRTLWSFVSWDLRTAGGALSSLSDCFLACSDQVMFGGNDWVSVDDLTDRGAGHVTWTPPPPPTSPPPPLCYSTSPHKGTQRYMNVWQKTTEN